MRIEKKGTKVSPHYVVKPNVAVQIKQKLLAYLERRRDEEKRRIRCRRCFANVDRVAGRSERRRLVVVWHTSRMCSIHKRAEQEIT